MDRDDAAKPVATGLVMTAQHTELPTAIRDLMSSRWFVPLAMAGLAFAVASVAVLRLAIFGWATVAADDSRYIFLGLSTFAGNGPVTPDGNLFLLRSPVYGLALAGLGSPFGDPLTGARIVAAALAVAGFIGAIRLGWLIAGPLGGLGTALALIGMPLLWRLLPTLRIDLPQTAGVVAVLLAIQQPTMRRWALAGALLGLTILVKETILLLVALPVAAFGFIPVRRLARLWVVYLAAVAVVAAWWWVVVWVKAGVIFPTNAIGTIERRDVGSDVNINLYGVVIIALSIGSWILVALRVRRELPARFLAVAAALVAVPALYATLNGLSTRNYANLAVLSSIAIGVALATAGPWVVRRLGSGRPSRAVAGLLVVVLLGGVVVGQRAAGRPSEQQLPRLIASWLRPRVDDGGRVVMTFLFSEATAVTFFGSVSVPKVPINRYHDGDALADYLWIGFRDKQLFAMRRTLWAAALTEPTTTRLVMTGPHSLTPDELLPALVDDREPGITFEKRLNANSRWSSIFVVDPTAIEVPTRMALHLSPATAGAWLDMASDAAGTAAREQELIGIRAVLVGGGSRALLRRIVTPACLVSAGEGNGPVILVAPGDPDASRPGSVCD